MEEGLNKAFSNKIDHILLWLAIIAYLLVNRSFLLESGGWEYYLTEIVIRVAMIAMLVYTNIYLLIPVLFYNRKYLLYGLCVSALIAFYVAVRNFQDMYQFRYITNQPGNAYFGYSTLPNISNAILYSCLCIALKFSKKFYVQQQLFHKIQLEQLDTELKYLKAQINPHSVFNSINSVYSLINKENSTARAALAKFSEMLRYQLYECNKDKIDIDKEINYLQNLIELQRLRKGENTRIDYCVTKMVKDFEIAPFLIAPFVENAFKYVSGFDETENFIKISLDKYDNLFCFKCVNTFEEKKILEIGNGGIGLKNVRRRLELLYPGKHILSIDQKEGIFNVSLKIEVDEN